MTKLFGTQLVDHGRQTRCSIATTDYRLPTRLNLASHGTQFRDPMVDAKDSVGGTTKKHLQWWMIGLLDGCCGRHHDETTTTSTSQRKTTRTPTPLRRDSQRYPSPTIAIFDLRRRVNAGASYMLACSCRRPSPPAVCLLSRCPWSRKNGVAYGSCCESTQWH